MKKILIATSIIILSMLNINHCVNLNKKNELKRTNINTKEVPPIKKLDNLEKEFAKLEKKEPTSSKKEAFKTLESRLDTLKIKSPSIRVRKKIKVLKEKIKTALK